MDAPLEPFAAFMARALYDPECGYYTRRIRTVGARGDFSTSATLTPVLARAIAGWLASECRSDLRVGDVIEVGGGDGSLMHGVRAALGWWRRRSLRFHLVETSPVLREQQQKRLGQRAVTWHKDIREALESAGGRAFIFHNELLDAFPATLVQWDAGGQSWCEVWLGREAGSGRRVESLQPLSLSAEEAAACSVLQHWNAGFPPPHPSQRCELALSVRHWLQSWASAWLAGAMLTIDYGGLFPDLYHRRPHGTLRAYLLQQRLEGAGVYANFGRQDITADVNFTDLRAWAAGLGWEEQAYGTQIELIETYAGRRRPNAAEAQWLDADGAGGAFKYLSHRRG